MLGAMVLTTRGLWLFALALLATLGVTRPVSASQTESPAPLRVTIRAGGKTHGPGQHDHPRFLEEWSQLLRERGAQVQGSLVFPSQAALQQTDVLVMYAANAASIEGEERARFEAFQKRGGGLVVIHDAVCGNNPAWFTERAGGAWEHGKARWLEGKIGLYFTDPHPITRGIPHFDLTDEIYYDMHLSPKSQVLANSFHDVFSVAPQMWVVDDPQGRVFVSLQGHEWSSFSHPAFRTLLLRGIAWAGKRQVDLFTHAEELAQLRYPPGGPLAPDKSKQSFQLNEEFEMNLVAAEPLVVNPISIDWDLQGRLWVAQTPGYPNKEQFSGMPAHDEIAILSDRDGDGRMDHSHVFAKGLDLVTSFVFHQDGVIVTQAPDILWLRDRDGDDVADERIVLYTGFGYGDTHAVTSNLRWGLDGWIYGTQGYSGGASRDIRSPYFDGRSGEASKSFGHIPGGVFRFQPDGSAIEAHSIYGSNTWGLDFNPAGDLFFTMANGSHLREVVLSEKELGASRIEGTRSWKDIVDHRGVHRISKADRAPYVQIDFVGGFTAASGCTIYSGGVWPGEYAGNHFVCEPTVNLVHRDVLVPEGAAHRASKPRKQEFLASTDPWFRPVQTKVAPDGSLYVVDFYNQAAVHNDTRGPEHGPTNAAKRPDRDREHGRIWRVQHREALDSPPVGAHYGNGLRDLRALCEGREIENPPPSRFSPLAEVRLRALWFDVHRQQLEAAHLGSALNDADPMLRRAAARIIGELAAGGNYVPGGELLTDQVSDLDPRVRLAALVSLTHFELPGERLEGLVQQYARLENDWSRSAFLRLAAMQPMRYFAAALKPAVDGEVAIALATKVAAGVAQRASSQEVLQALQQLAQAKSAASLSSVVQALQKGLPQDFRFGTQNSAAGDALVQLFRSNAGQADVSRALLPLAAFVQGSASLDQSIAVVAQELLSSAQASEAGIDERLDALGILLDLPTWRAAAIQASAGLIGPHLPPEAQERLIRALARTEDLGAASLLSKAFPTVTHVTRDAIFREIIQRPSWTERLLDEIEEGEISVGELGPRRVFRLREHSNQATAERAKRVLDELTTPSPDMEQLIAQILPILQQPADVPNGKQVFIQNCAVCHRHEGLPAGVGADVGPSLVGMGAHGAEHLLPFILDPNLSVEAAYLEYVAETKQGQMLTGVLTYDGPDSITLASSGGTENIPRKQIESLYSTGRSPMPTGFESLGAETLRDLLAFICGEYGDFRIVSLKNQFTASTSKGLYDRRYDAQPIRFEAYGVLDVMGTPMEVFDPASMPEHNNALVLKGGARDDWESKALMPQRVEVHVGFALQRMHVLGGISAWGHPFFGDGEPLVKWTFHYADGTEELHTLHDGVEFADWIRRHDVPGSQFVEGLIQGNSAGQVRTFSLDPGKPELVIERITLESFDNRMAPTFLALTAQLQGAQPKQPVEAEPVTHPRLLILGGGSSHDFGRWFDQELRTTASQVPGFPSSEIEYTDRFERALARLAGLDVLMLTNNQPIPSADLRRGIFEHVAGGAGLILVHPALWYNWQDWPEYNRELVGGGSRSHENYGTFDVQVASDHELLQGIPQRFVIADELYRFEADPKGTPIEVLANGISRSSGDSFPVIWITKTKQGRVLCTTLGHDGAAHQNPAFRRLMQNAVRWAAGSDD